VYITGVLIGMNIRDVTKIEYVQLLSGPSTERGLVWRGFENYEIPFYTTLKSGRLDFPEP
jgi:hypothetical protein